MKQIVILGDTFNKVSDTSSAFRFNLVKDGVIQDVGHQQLSVTIANSSGYLFDIIPVNSGTEIWVDFNDEKLKTLTPDDYQLEIRVTNTDGDVEIYPSNGSIPFTVTKNLRSSTGQTVPYVTFDDVLKGVDEKVATYTRTIAKGDKGDTGARGPAGKDGVTPNVQVGGRNLLLGSADWSGSNFDGRGTLSSDKFGLLTISKLGQAWLSPRYDLLSLSSRGVIETGKDYTFSTYIRNTSNNDYTIAAFGNSDIMTGWGNYQTIPAGKDWTRIYAVIRFSKVPDASNSTGDMHYLSWGTGDSFSDNGLQLAGYNLEAGNIPTDWMPAPEDKANDNTVLHNTGNETATGNKTFTGQTTLLLGNSGFRITTTGFEKSTDGGKTWVTANI